MRHTKLDTESIAQALRELSVAQPGAGLLALLPEGEKDKLPLLQSACRANGVALAGGIFPALIDGAAFITEGAWLLPFASMPPCFLIEDVNAGKPSGVDKIVGAVQDGLQHCSADGQKPTLFLIFDGLVPNIASLLDGVYLALANRVEYAGVNAGSETFQPMPCLFDAQRLIGNGVLGLLLPGDAATVLEHGFVQPERAMAASSTEGNRIASIDWRPAFEVYQEVIKAEYGIDLTAANFYEHGVHFPFGILRANGEVIVRVPVAMADDGSLFCIGEVPENAMLVLLKSPAAGANTCLERLAARLDFGAAGPTRKLLVFYCAGRRMHLGRDAATELARLRDEAGVSGMAGALSLGEIGSTTRGGYPMFHNATLVCRPWLRS